MMLWITIYSLVLCLSIGATAYLYPESSDNTLVAVAVAAVYMLLLFAYLWG